MESQFSKLRFKDLGRIAGAVAVSSAVALTPVVAGASTGGRAPIAAHVHWHVNTNITFNTTSSNFGMSEAAFTNAPSKNDAYDGALSWMVGVASPTTPDTSKGYKSPGASPAIDSTTVPGAQIVHGNPQTISGLTVTGEFFFLNSTPIARSMLVLTNPTGAPITVNLLNYNNLGSDANTSFFSTSSGDNMVSPADHWFTSYQAPSGGNSSDPVDTIAWSSPGAAVPGTMVGASGDDNPYYYLTVTVPAGATRRVLMFSRLTQVDNTSGNDADWLALLGPGTNAGAATFNSVSAMNAAGYFGGLTPQQRSEVVNFSAAQDVPTSTPWTRAGFAAALGAVGLSMMQAMRRRRIRLFG